MLTSFLLLSVIHPSFLNGADYLEIAKETGSVEVWKKADLILINGDLA